VQTPTTGQYLIGGASCGVGVFLVTLVVLNALPVTDRLTIAGIGFLSGAVCSVAGVRLGFWWMARRNPAEEDQEGAEPVGPGNAGLPPLP